MKRLEKWAENYKMRIGLKKCKQIPLGEKSFETDIEQEGESWKAEMLKG